MSADQPLAARGLISLPGDFADQSLILYVGPEESTLIALLSRPTMPLGKPDIVRFVSSKRDQLAFRSRGAGKVILSRARVEFFNVLNLV
jgi:hypothetical protein